MSAPVLIDERFELLEKVARGGMGAVFRAFDQTTQQVVAIKVLREQADEAIVRFWQETRVLGEIEHAHVVRYICHGRMASGEPYLAMEWLEGETLAARLERGPLSIDETVQLARRVASGLGAAHARGIVHRDVKPSNVRLRSKDGEPIVTDFGLAQIRNDEDKLTADGMNNRRAEGEAHAATGPIQFGAVEGIREFLQIRGIHIIAIIPNF